MPTIVTITAQDDAASYVLTAQATGPQSGRIAERRTDKASGAVTNASYDISGATVVNGTLKGTLHLPGFQTESISLELEDNMATIKTGGLWFGVGAQTLGPWVLAPIDMNNIVAWMTNFPHS